MLAENGRIAPAQGTKQRNTNLELFRILTMLLIVAHHYVVNSGLADVNGPIYSDPLSVRSLFLLLFGAWGKIGINCFVLITGYFMCRSTISAKKFAKLLFEVMFYRLAINGIFWLTGYSAFSFSALLKVLIPITSIGTGFTNAFLVFFLCIPFINILLRHMTQKQHLYLLLLMSFLYVFLGTFRFYFSVKMNYVSWYFVLYLFASYIRLYPKKWFDNTKLWGWLALASTALSALSVVACAWLSARLGKVMAYDFVSDSNSFLALTTGLCAFLFFKNVKVPHSPFINTVAASCFGVLLIHANSDTMRRWLWVDVLDNVGMYGSPWMPIHAILSVLVIYAVCTAIDLLRIRFLEKPLFRLWDKHWDRLAAAYTKAETALCKKLHIED